MHAGHVYLCLSIYDQKFRKVKYKRGGESALLGNLGFHQLIFNAKTGDKEALSLIVYKLSPALKKHSHRMSYAGAYNDLIIWLLDAIDQYQA